MFTHRFIWRRFTTQTGLLASMVIVSCALTMLPGCGPKRPATTPVSGKVTLSGKPLTTGQIVFYPERGRSSMATIGADGTFKLTTFEKGDGALPGHHKVTITAKHSPQYNSAPKSFKAELEMGGRPKSFGVVQWIVPERYSRRETTPLKADVALGEDNIINFDIPK